MKPNNLFFSMIRMVVVDVASRSQTVPAVPEVSPARYSRRLSLLINFCVDSLTLGLFLFSSKD
jgi:hypothetical protein